MNHHSFSKKIWKYLFPKEHKAWVDLQSQLQEVKENLSREREELSALMTAISDAILAIDLQGIPLFYKKCIKY